MPVAKLNAVSRVFCCSLWQQAEEGGEGKGHEAADRATAADRAAAADKAAADRTAKRRNFLQILSLSLSLSLCL